MDLEKIMTVPFLKSLIIYPGNCKSAQRNCFPGLITQRAEVDVKMCKSVGTPWKRSGIGSSS